MAHTGFEIGEQLRKSNERARAIELYAEQYGQAPEVMRLPFDQARAAEWAVRNGFDPADLADLFAERARVELVDLLMWGGF